MVADHNSLHPPYKIFLFKICPGFEAKWNTQVESPSQENDFYFYLLFTVL